MNKLLTFPGLQPIYLGDFDFLQQSVNDAFLQLLKGLTGQDNPRCILKAATPEKDGAICFDGEILPLKYYSGAVIGALVYKIESSYSGERTFKDGKTEKCYESRYVVATSGSTLDHDKSSSFPMLQDLLARAVKINQYPAWRNYGGEEVILQMYRSVVGNLYTLIGKIAIAEDCTVSSLIPEPMIVDFPTGDYLFPLTVENNGVLKTIPGKMIVTFDSDSNHNMMTLTIPQTKFVMDDKGYFTINAMKSL